jgi:hypothetical protein
MNAKFEKTDTKATLNLEMDLHEANFVVSLLDCMAVGKIMKKQGITMPSFEESRGVASNRCFWTSKFLKKEF